MPALMEPWDGPAAMAFTDGKQIGATLDRNGLRPARYLVTKDDMVIMSSESGVLPVAEENIVQKWRLQPGKMLLIDLEKGRIVSDDELKADIASSYPYEQWLKRTQIMVHGPAAATGEAASKKSNVGVLDLQQAFGYTQESIKFLMTPMAETGQEAIGSMGNDTPISALSSKSKLLHTYFKQNFAQVTNPPIDSIREELVMSLVSFIGPRPNLLDLEGTSKQKRLEVDQPILTNEDLERIRQIGAVKDNDFSSVTIDITFDARRRRGRHGSRRSTACAPRPKRPCAPRSTTSSSCPTARAGPDRMAIPSLLATSAVHHHLIKQGLRTSVGLVVETGEAHEVHQFCTLAGYGAEAINPYLAFETLEAMLPELGEGATANEVKKRYIKAVGKAMLKVMAKMGISTYQSYCGAQIFDAVGLKGRSCASISPARIRRSRASAARDRARDVPSGTGSLRQRAGARQRARCRRRIRLPRPRRSAHVAAQRGRRSAARRARHRRPGRDERQGSAEIQGLRAADQRPVRAADDAARHVPHPLGRGDGPQARAAIEEVEPAASTSSSASRPAR